ncbi:MAG: 2-C-methyl-D-erythritol 4-phosphate cytidylyltransferase [Wujia sp.]
MAVAIVLAAGSGSRMHSEVAKQYLELNGKAVLAYSLQTFQNHRDISEIVLVTRADEIKYCKKEIVDRYDLDKVTHICAGGAERYHSVYNGLSVICGELTERGGCISEEIVMIHDGARPFVSSEMIDHSIEAAEAYGACTVAVPVKDTIKIVDENNFGKETPDRRFLYQIQTPQTFRYSLLMESYRRMMPEENHKITDDTMVVEQYGGVPVKIVPGAYENIKITTPEDMEIASKFAEKFF